MGAQFVEMTAFEQLPPGDPQWHLATVDLGGPHTFLAWASTGLIYGQGSGPWDFDNAIAAEVFQVDGNIVASDVSGETLGPPGDLRNLFQTCFVGYGSTVTFRLRVWQTEEMSVVARGIVLFDI
jgi:hypothetical protein